MTSLAGRNALVTGAASGIGRETALELARRGARVAIADRNAEGGERVAAEIGEHAKAFAVDVASRASCEELLAGVAEAFGPPHILVHSAGIGVELPFLETREEDWRRILDVNLTGTFFVAQATARRMAENGYGRIVLLASAAGLRGGTGRAAYGASKGGIIALTRVMAVELAPLGITVNALAPGAIETELVKKMHDAETRRAYLSGIPADRYGTPAEVAAVAAFLASTEAGYVTGQTIGIDGGFLGAGVMKRPS